MTTAPHPTPEERVEAALNDWRKDAGDLRVHFARAIREAEAAGEARGRAMERAERSPGITWAQRLEALMQGLGREPTLDELLFEARRHSMTPDEIEEQRRSWVRSMTYRCEHGIADFEQCPDCRARTNKESSDDTTTTAEELVKASLSEYERQNGLD